MGLVPIERKDLCLGLVPLQLYFEILELLRFLHDFPVGHLIGAAVIQHILVRALRALVGGLYGFFDG